MLLYAVVLVVLKSLQALPLRWVARLGRAGGALAYRIDRRHRRVALANLTQCFGREKSGQEIQALARENFRRIGENFACGVKTATMVAGELRPHLEFVGVEKIYPEPFEGPAPNRVIAIGHFGNFELYARFGQYWRGVRTATTYRALRQPGLNRLMQNLRTRSDCLFFERRSDAAALKSAMLLPGIMLGLLADQHAGARGLPVPFFGHACSTSAAPAVFALRYQCPLFTAVCFRTALAQWRIEVSAEIATHEAGKPRPLADIMLDVNRSFEQAVRRDPANWFWVHRRWKPDRHRRGKMALAASAPATAAPPAGDEEKG